MRGPAPGAENQTADCKVHEWPPHIDQDERPLVRFEGREHGDGRVFDEKKGEPTEERDFQTGNCVRGIHASDQPGQRIINNNGRNDRQKVSAYAMSALDVGHGEVASESTFKRVLERVGLTQKRRQRRRSTQAGRLSSGKRAAAPNEVWTVDFKGWWRSWGKRCEPLTVRDEHSRYILELRAMEGAGTEKVRQSFERLFERAGLPEAIRSDNGAPFASVHGVLGLSRLSAWWVALGIDLERGRPGHPRDNAAHERMHGDISREIEALGQSAQEAMDIWRQSFNYERPHEALLMRCPGELYRVSERKYQGTPEDLDYPQMCSRRVSSQGAIKLDGQTLFLSTALAGWSVGLKPISEQRMEVWFGRLPLGEVDLAKSGFIRADLRLNKTQRSAEIAQIKPQMGQKKCKHQLKKCYP